MFGAVEEVAPGTILNPYADQRAFQHNKETGKRERGGYSEKEVRQFSDFVDWSIAESKRPDARIVKRWPHWGLHRAAIDLHSGDPRKMADSIAGWNSWRCYNNVGAGFFVQVGRSPKSRTFVPLAGLKSSSPPVYPGGHLGCYWDPLAVTQTSQYGSSTEVVDYLHYGMKKLAAANPDPCPGCRMPRLDSLHLVILESGIPDGEVDLQNQYQRQRRIDAGF
jgi:hypothetical protein